MLAKLKHLYILLALIGLVSTWYFNIQFFMLSEDASLINFFAQINKTLPGKSINADISVVVITFFVWMVYESRKLKIKHWWIIIPLTFLVAIAVSFPIFLYMRANRIEQLEKYPTKE